MEACHVLIAGGGPAGSACAWKLQQAGLDVVVVDGATFPRDKVCAGWITPQVIDDLRIDTDEYRRGRTFQPITGFRTGIIGRSRDLETTYTRAVSFGIRRCEFDFYLLQRSGARLCLGTRISSVRRDGEQWVVNERFRTAVLVGAGGHFCPVARTLNPTFDGAPLVVAQEAEFEIPPEGAGAFTTAPETPELYFSQDLKGYGWCFRKEGYLNVGFGRLESGQLPRASAEFVDFLKAAGKIPADTRWRWRGHAYLLSTPPRRRIVDDGVILVGDAAGLAYPQSGEGIRPAIESGLIAAATIAGATGRYTRAQLARHEERLRARFSDQPLTRMIARTIPSSLTASIATWLFDSPAFVRHVLLDRWFLHADEPALSAA
ncbi:MAG TPA: NAD(P)/FAD-dependent oxidoreductase [Vicinamibacterales bacterium]|jgi:flavin-dependent dehydrogenase|nr:NAD(P)/FAD-dependent oxidoreductase [Vicinamibacterales bacterium]